ncbi:Protein kinase of the Mitotic Exit Network [Savitreella phatthalungensis]
MVDTSGVLDSHRNTPGTNPKLTESVSPLRRQVAESARAGLARQASTRSAPTTPKSLDIFDRFARTPRDRAEIENTSVLSNTSSNLTKRTSIEVERVRVSLTDPHRDFTIGKCIGKGQYGRVHQGYDVASGELVAIKRIDLIRDTTAPKTASASKSKVAIEEIMCEVEILRACAHRHVVRYIGFTTIDPGLLDIVTEFVEGGSLADVIRQFGVLGETRSLSYSWQILDALDYVHGLGIVHCDIKSANVLVTKRGCCKLSDFGVSIKVDGETTVKGLVQGTPNWLAPEIITLRGTSKASDVWAVGCCIIEMLSGQPPYAKLNAMTAMFKIVEDDHPPLPNTISSELRELLLSMFDKEPRRRPSAHALKLRPVLDRHRLQELPPPNSMGEIGPQIDLAAVLPHPRKPNFQSAPRPVLGIHKWSKLKLSDKGMECALCREALCGKARVCGQCRSFAHPRCVIERRSWCVAVANQVEPRRSIVTASTLDFDAEKRAAQAAAKSRRRNLLKSILPCLAACRNLRS